MDPPLGFASADTVFRSYGLLYLVATVLMFVGFLALRVHLRPFLAGRGARWLKIATVGWWMVLTGLVGDYGISDTFRSAVHIVAFLTKMLGVLILLIGLLFVGIGLRRSGSFPAWVSWPLIAALPLGIFGVILLGHLPSGPMLGLNMVWVIVRFALWRESLALDQARVAPST